ncbi:MAG: hypothetical protein AAB225_23900 [Acidobacteriota bacterium]
MVAQAEELSSRLRDFLRRQPLVGLKSARRRTRFIEKLRESEKKLRVLRRRRFHGATDPLHTTFHPLRCIVENFKHKNPDEAVWLAFLSVQFGWDGTSGTGETIRRFYSRFGHGLWDWKAVAQASTSVRDWMRENSRRLHELRFGNHRKYETNRPDSKFGTPAVIESFVRWVAKHGNTSPYEAFQSFVEHAESREAAFDDLFWALKIRRFGRTAKFDLLCLLGNLGILPVAPPHPYLRGATGPRAGALLLVTGKKVGNLTTEIIDIVRELQSALGSRPNAWKMPCATGRRRRASCRGHAELRPRSAFFAKTVVAGQLGPVSRSPHDGKAPPEVGAAVRTSCGQVSLGASSGCAWRGSR